MNGREVFTAAFPDRRIDSTEKPDEGNRKETTIVTAADGERVVVQLSDDPKAAATETRLTREIAERTPVPVPSVIDAGSVDGTGYRIAACVEGENLHERFPDLDPERRARVARRFGGALASLHEGFEFERFGRVTSVGGRLEATGPAEYEPWFRRYAEIGIDALPPELDDLIETLAGCIESVSFRTSPTPRLFPWDLRPGNVVVEDGRVVAFLDWGQPLAAGTGLSVAKTEYLVADWYGGDRGRLRSAFRDGYTAVRPLPTVTRAERLAAVLRSAVDGDGEVTRPGYPERTGSDAVAFHRKRLFERLR